MSDWKLATIIKALRNYSSNEWDLFVEEWVRGLKKQYVDVKRIGGPGDMGRDVVAFSTEKKFDDEWDNYQCKHTEKNLTASQAGIEIAKIIFHSFNKSFSPPRKMYFCAPRDVAIELVDLLGSPKKLRVYILTHWDSGYSKHITEKQEILLIGELKKYAENFDYSIFSWLQTSEMIEAHRKTAHWAQRFGGLLPPFQPGKVPSNIQPNESIYIAELLFVYGEQQNKIFQDMNALSDFPKWKSDIEIQRERFFQAEAFARAYRDETPAGTLEEFSDDIFDLIDPIVKQNHPNGFERLNECLSKAGSFQPNGILAPHARPKVKQGICHHLANNRKVKWILRDDG